MPEPTGPLWKFVFVFAFYKRRHWPAAAIKKERTTSSNTWRFKATALQSASQEFCMVAMVLARHTRAAASSTMLSTEAEPPRETIAFKMAA